MAEASGAEKAEALLGEAVLLRAQKRFKEALEKAQQALIAKPENPDAFGILGDIYLDMGMPEAGIEAYARALELNPAQSQIEKKLARAALQKYQAEREKELVRNIVEGKVSRTRNRSPAIAGLLSILVPGLGQIYNRQWLKAAALICVFMLMLLGEIASILNLVLSQQTAGTSSIGLLALLGIFFSPPAIWWTLLLFVLYVYSVADAAFVATRSETEESGLI